MTNETSPETTSQRDTTLPLVFDGHNDTLMRLYAQQNYDGSAFFKRNEGGHVDLPRARAGGFGGGFFAIYVPADPSAGPHSDDVIRTSRGYQVPLAAAL